MRRLTDAERDTAAELFPVALAIARKLSVGIGADRHVIDSAAGMAACDVAANPDVPNGLSSFNAYLAVRVRRHLINDLRRSWFSGRKANSQKLKRPIELVDQPSAPSWIEAGEIEFDPATIPWDALTPAQAHCVEVMAACGLSASQCGIPKSTALRVCRDGLTRLRTLLSEAS